MIIKDALSAFEEVLWESSGFPGEVKNLTRTAVRDRIKNPHEDSANLGPKGHRLKRKTARMIRKTLKHLKNAVLHVGNHEDPEIRRKAKKLIRSVQYLNYEESEVEASGFHGSLQEAGRRRKETHRRGIRKTYPHEGGEIVQINSSQQLASVSRTLGFCTAHYNRKSDGYSYHRHLKDGSWEFYAFYNRHGHPYALMSVNAETREVQEFRRRRIKRPDFSKSLQQRLQELLCRDRTEFNEYEGAGRIKSPVLSQKLLLDICGMLDVNGDDNKVFVRAGAFFVFLGGVPEVPSIVHDGCEYTVWTFPGQGRVVIRQSSALSSGSARAASIERPSYSLFIRESQRPTDPRKRAHCMRTPLANWSAGWHNAMTEREFLDLVLQCPDIAEVVRDVEAVENQESGVFCFNDL